MTKVDAAAIRRTRVLASGEAAIDEAAACLRAGGLVAMPTETVYGLAADATNERAVAALYAAKGRPSFNPLIAHFADAAAAAQQAILNDDARRLAEAFWPGPLTLVAPVGEACRVGLLARAGLSTLALRVPAHPIAQSLIAAAGRPLVAPSANRSGHVSATSARHVLDDLEGRIDLILDDGPCRIGVESTIVACLDGGPKMLRPGAIAKDQIEAALGRRLANANSDPGAPLAPGGLASHYAPRARLRLNAAHVGAGEVGLDFASRFIAAGGGPTLDLSPSGDLNEAAANLFAHLRRLDAGGAEAIAVAPVPTRGLGAAINDRLMRAASGHTVA